MRNEKKDPGRPIRGDRLPVVVAETLKTAREAADLSARDAYQLLLHQEAVVLAQVATVGHAAMIGPLKGKALCEGEISVWLDEPARKRLVETVRLLPGASSRQSTFQLIVVGAVAGEGPYGAKSPYGAAARFKMREAE